MKPTTDDQTLYQQFLACHEPAFLELQLRRHNGNLSACARAIGLNRATLRKRLQLYRINADALMPVKRRSPVKTQVKNPQGDLYIPCKPLAAILSGGAEV